MYVARLAIAGRALYSQRVFAEMAPHRGQSSGTKSRPAVALVAQNALECTGIRECTLYGYVPPLNASAMHALRTESTYRAIRFAAIDVWCFRRPNNGDFAKLIPREDEEYYLTLTRTKKKERVYYRARVIFIVKSAIIISRKFFITLFLPPFCVELSIFVISYLLLYRVIFLFLNIHSHVCIVYSAVIYVDIFYISTHIRTRTRDLLFFVLSHFSLLLGYKINSNIWVVMLTFCANVTSRDMRQAPANPELRGRFLQKQYHTIEYNRAKIDSRKEDADRVISCGMTDYVNCL